MTLGKAGEKITCQAWPSSLKDPVGMILSSTGGGTDPRQTFSGAWSGERERRPRRPRQGFHPNNLHEAKLKSNELISLAE